MFCRQCKHQLTGVRDPRCPECGKSFNIADVTSFLADAEDFSDRQNRALSAMLAGTFLVAAVFVTMVCASLAKSFHQFTQ